MFTRRSLVSCCAALLLAGLATATLAADATGTWKWTQAGRGGGAGGAGGGAGNGAAAAGREVTLKLTQDGEKLTGTLTMPAFGGRRGGGDNGGAATSQPAPVDIKDGKIDKDGNLSFTVSRTMTPPGGDSTTIVTKYSGKLDGDTIKGKSETDFNGNVREQTFEAKRAKEEKK